MRLAPATAIEAGLKPVILAGAVLLAAVAGWTDLRSRRIPNWLTVPGFVRRDGKHDLAGERRIRVFPARRTGRARTAAAVCFAAQSRRRRLEVGRSLGSLCRTRVVDRLADRLCFRRGIDGCGAGYL